MSEQQDEHSRSPECRTPQGVLTARQTIDALVYARGSENKVELHGLHDNVSNRLFTAYNLLREGFGSSLLHDYRALHSLDFGKTEQSDFWKEHQETVNALETDLYSAYVEEVAGKAAYVDALIETYPRLFILDDPTGPYIQGIDAAFEEQREDASAGEASLVIYTDTGEIETLHGYANRPLFVNVAALPETYQIAVRQYRRDFAV